MTKVSFYLSKNSKENARISILTKIVKKAYLSGYKVYVVAKDQREAEEIDLKLWDFESNRFIPHGLVNTPLGGTIAIGWGQEPESHDQVLVNLFNSIPPFFSRFRRLIEIIDTANPSDLTRGRANWKFYKDRGYLLEKYNV